jgi:hypothetical protein
VIAAWSRRRRQSLPASGASRLRRIAYCQRQHRSVASPPGGIEARSKPRPSGPTRASR